MEFSVHIDTSDAQGVFNQLASGALRNRLLRAVGGVAQRQTVKRFSEKVSPDGAPWAAWSAGYAGSKSQKGRGLLVRTGQLRGSITNIVAGDSVHVGTNVFYGKFHQFGTSKMPARPFVGASADNIQEFGDTLVKYLKAIFG